MPNQEYIKREMFDKIAAHLEKPEITLLTGSRQVGKTVLLEQLKTYLADEKKVPSDAILWYNLDLIQDWEVFQSQSDFIEFLRGRSKNQKIYAFIDEAQKVSETARFFKGIYDSKLNIKFILTGSSSLEIKAKLKETLAGRKRVFHIPSFTFYEFLSIKEIFLAECLKKGDPISEIDQKKLNSYYEEYLVFGGYPRVVISESKEEKIAILREIFSSYIEKDVVGFLEIKNKTAFSRMIKLLAAQIGQLVNIGELALHLGIDRHTVERYILALEETFVVRKISPYFKNPRQEIIKAAKIYFLDSGIRNLAVGNFQSFPGRPDKGPILENGICSDLLNLCESMSAELHFWRTKQKTEIDFVVEIGLEVLPIEAKSLLGKTTVLPPLKLFIEKFSPKKALVANLTFNNECIKYVNTEIRFIYPYQIKRNL